MNDGCGVGIAKVMNIGGGRVEEGGTERIDPLAREIQSREWDPLVDRWDDAAAWLSSGAVPGRAGTLGIG